jgi:hypothetical protein
MFWILDTAVSVLAAVAVIGVCFVIWLMITVGHVRPWATHRSFDVDEYVQSTLYPHVVQCLRDVSALRAEAAPARAARVHASATGVVVIDTTSGQARSACLALHAMLVQAVPALGAIDDHGIDSYSESEFLTKLVDIADAASLRNSTPHAVTQAISGCASGADVSSTVARSMAGLLLTLSADDLDTIRSGASDSGLADAVRAHLAGGVAQDDAFVAHIAAAVRAAPGDSEHARVAKVMSKALIAVSELGTVYRNVIPQVRTMRFVRRPTMDITEVAWIFMMPYVNTYFAGVQAAVARASAGSGGAFERAQKFYSSNLKALRESVVGKEPFAEPFADPVVELPKLVRAVGLVMSGDDVGVYIDSEGHVRTSEAFIGTLKKMVKAVISIAKLIPQLIKLIPVVISMITKIMEILPKAVTKLLKIFAKIDRPNGVVLTVIDIVTLCAGVCLLVALSLAQIPFTYVTWMLFVLVAPALTVAYLTAVCAVGVVAALVLATADVASGGVLRFLARSEDHPELWWAGDHFEDGNKTDRILGASTPCFTGYSPGMTRLFCWRRSACLASNCPASTMMRGYRTNAYVPTLSLQRVLPSDAEACVPRVRKQLTRCDRVLSTGTGPGASVNGHVLQGEPIARVVRCLGLCRLHVLPGSDETTAALTRLALRADPLLSIICKEHSGPLRIPQHTGHGVSLKCAVVVLAALALALARTDQLSHMIKTTAARR